MQLFAYVRTKWNINVGGFCKKQDKIGCMENITQYDKGYCRFNVHGSVHRNNILLYKSQQDEPVTEFI